MPALLPYAGLLVLIAMIIFIFENIETLKKTKLKTLTVKTVVWSNGYLLLGILTGFAVALGLNSDLGIDIPSMLIAHVYGVIGGYVILTIMGLSLILVPMFSLVHGFDEKAIKMALSLIIFSVAMVFAGAVLGFEWIMVLGYALGFVGIFFIFGKFISLRSLQ